MPVDLRGVRVFIASPGGLDDERRQFREALREFNEDLGHDQGVTFIPVGWELTRAGMGRPQEKINEDVRQSDFTVLVLWDRWGSDPGSGPYTSGTEEEYNVARECIADPHLPMRDILVLFKGVDAKQLSDPGAQLKRVLAFKKSLEKEKTLLFQTFDTASEFERHLRRQLPIWAKAGTESEKQPGSAPPPSDGEQATPLPNRETVDDAMDLVSQADAHAKAGELVEAESLYARAVVGRQDLHALTKYVRFLRRSGRLDQASALSDRLLEMATEQHSPITQIEALSNRAIVKRKLGDLNGSLKDLEAAVTVAEAQGADGGRDLAFLLDNIGLTQRKAGSIAEALRTHMRAIDVRKDVDDPRGLANTLNHTGALMNQLGRYSEAEVLHRRALNAFIEQDYERGQAQARANLGEDLLALGHLDEADKELQRSLSLNEKLGSAEGMGMNHWQLGRLALKRGRLEEARNQAYNAFQADDSSGRPEGVAGAYHLLGQILILEGEPQSALPVLESAIETYKNGNHRLGQAWTLLDLARARGRSGDPGGASQALDEAASLGRTLGHVEFEGELLKARQDLLNPNG